MVFYGIVFFLLLLAMALKFLGWQGEKKFKLRTTETLNELRTAVSGTGKTAYDAKDFEALPPPVKNYLKRAMPEQGLFINRIHLRQKGEIRVHDEASWNKFSADQYVSMNPAQFLWAATSEYWPMTPLGIITSYISGKGKTAAWLWGWVTAYENSGLQMKAYLMLRWLGEAVWYPTALLPGEEIKWEPLTSKSSETRSARIIFKSGMMRVSGIFTFMKSNGAPLMFMVEDGGMPELNIYKFYCTYSGWKRFGDYQVPTEVTEGLVQGGTRDDRLKVRVLSIDFAN